MHLMAGRASLLPKHWLTGPALFNNDQCVDICMNEFMFLKLKTYIICVSTISSYVLFCSFDEC